MTWLSALLLLLASVMHPARAACPRHWWLSHGVRASGVYVCALLDGSEALWPIAPSVESRVYCTNGQEPITVNGTVVSCQQRH